VNTTQLHEVICYATLSATSVSSEFVVAVVCCKTFKGWCLCSADGYLFQFLLYAGRDTGTDYDMGLGASVVLQLLKSVEDPREHAVYFDNFFTSHKLLMKLREEHFHATGTVREQRLIDCPLASGKSLKKNERGSYVHSFGKANEVMAVKWNDNSVVALATNFQNVEPLLPAKRFSRYERFCLALEHGKIFLMAP